jgi:hypothetical protein
VRVVSGLAPTAAEERTCRFDSLVPTHEIAAR